MTAQPPGGLGRFLPRSFRALTAVGMLGALLVIVITQGVLTTILDRAANREVERQLSGQAAAILDEVIAAPRPQRDDAARRAATLLPDTRVLVREAGTTIFWSRPNGATYARASAQRGPIEVRLERVDPVSSVDRPLVFLTTVLGIGVAALAVWLVSATLAQRLRGQLRRLSNSAERISAGHLDERVEVSDDEVGRVAEVFNRMATKLELDDLRQRDFLADVAHELRTPVTAIEGFAGALADGTARSDEDRREAAEFICAESGRMRSLINDFQELTWLDLDPEVNAVPVDLSELAQTAVARFEAYAAARGVTVTADDGYVPAITDPDHVTTILSNLVSNAIKATPDGGTVTIHTAVDGGDAVIRVSDTGVGIEPQYLPYLFDRLYRVETSRVRDDDSGSGLGLSIVRRLTLLLGGRISVRSTPGEGTEFTVWLLGARMVDV
ncbi:MAG: HAMP domain-containing histidine kinase [Actinobacteria bacterium]|nr:HAMP domain-containing histidine kinase [Thermoleophilia bacterium]MCB9010210.1 HAMP domain-containing histidine kinase [Actinomycetota bacterium]